MTFTVDAPLFTEDRSALVVLGKIDSAGSVEKEVTQTSAYGKYVVFANLEPGKYKVLRAIQTQKSTGGPMAPVGGGFAVGISYSPTYTVEFGPEVAQLALVQVPPGVVAYLGDFSVTAKLKIGFGGPEFGKPGRELTDGGQRRAYEMLKAIYPDSPWVQKLGPPVFGAVVDQLTGQSRMKACSDKGVLVLTVGSDSPASAAGIEGGAVLTQVGDRVIANRQSFDEALDQYAGKTVAVKYCRYDREYPEEYAVEVRFNERTK